MNTKFLDDIYQQCEGEMLVAVPHQDVLVIADIRNKTGYDVMAHLTMEFFTKGLVQLHHYHLVMKKDILNLYSFWVK